jgi:hypothetical protein
VKKRKLLAILPCLKKEKAGKLRIAVSGNIRREKE